MRIRSPAAPWRCGLHRGGVSTAQPPRPRPPQRRRRLRPRCAAHPRAPLLRVPRIEEVARQAPAAQPRLHRPRRRLRPGRRGRQGRRQPVDPPRAGPGRRGPHAARCGPAGRDGDRDPPRLDRPGRQLRRRPRATPLPVPCHRRFPPLTASPGTPSPGSAGEGRRALGVRQAEAPGPAAACSNESWVRNADRSLRAGAARPEKPVARASRRRGTLLLRRVSLDLIGLPPTPEEVDAFVADGSPDAYEKAVDRLLASPHYGERWARPWLDLARYADTNGLREGQSPVDLEVSRLGDRRPQPRPAIRPVHHRADRGRHAAGRDSRASGSRPGFHRNAMTNEEGGVDPEESLYEVLVDRVNTTATVWLGSTLACAQCHNHKYDPFSQKDYFRFLAFFAGTDYEKTSSNDGNALPRGQARSRLARAGGRAQAARKREIDRLHDRPKKPTPALAAAQADWEDEQRPPRARGRRWCRPRPRRPDASP